MGGSGANGLNALKYPKMGIRYFFLCYQTNLSSPQSRYMFDIKKLF